MDFTPTERPGHRKSSTEDTSRFFLAPNVCKQEKPQETLRKKKIKGKRLPITANLHLQPREEMEEQLLLLIFSRTC
jgi:hypothetical protein